MLTKLHNFTNLQTKILIICGVFICLFFYNQAQATTPTYESAPTASEVLVVYNSSYTTDSDSDETQDSQEIAEYYVSQRPGANITSIATETDEIISRTNYNSQIRDALESYMTSEGIASTTKFIILVKGIPLKISSTNGGSYGETDYSSVDSAVCLLYEDYDITWRQNNPYYNVDTSYTKAYRFDNSHFRNSAGVALNYLVTRIDGYTVADMEAIVDRGVGADTSGNGYWIIDDHQKTYDSMSTAYDRLNSLSRNINPDPWSDTSSYVLTNAGGSIIGYTSHGIHASMGDGYVSNSPENPNHLDFNFLNGAVFSTYESYNAYGFVSKTQSTHGQIAEWVEIGGAGGIGNVYEPWASTIAEEYIWMPEYTIGYTWAEAAYMSLPYMDFVSVVIGDPLMTISEITAPSEVTSAGAVAGDQEVALSWTNPGDGDFAGVKVLRQTGSYPAHSADGTLIYNGTDEFYTDTNVSNGTTYYYAFFAYDEVPNYSTVDGAGAKDTATPSVDTTAPAAVINMNAVAGSHQIALTWTNPSDEDFAGTKVVRKEGSYPTSHTDGTAVYNSTGESYTNTGLDNGTTYFYTAFAYDAGPNYSTPIDGSRASAVPYLEGDSAWLEIDIMPPGVVTNFSATPSDGQVSLAWTNPGDQDGVVIIRRTDYYPQTKNNGDLICNSIDTSCTDSNVVNDTTYFYTAFAYDDNLNYSDFTSNSQDYATPCADSCEDTSPQTAPSPYFSEPDMSPPTEIDDFTATPGNGEVSLSWTNPGDESQIIVVRRSDYYPQSPSNGQLICKTIGTSCSDYDVINDTTYFYTAFSVDTALNFSGFTNNSQDYATPCADSCEDTAPQSAPDSYFSEPDMSPPTEIDDFTATPGDGQVSLSWTNPFDDEDWIGTLILRRTDRYSYSYSDGTLIYNGLDGGTYTDIDVSNGTTYYYTGFSYDSSGNYSAPSEDSRDSAMPSS